MNSECDSEVRAHRSEASPSRGIQVRLCYLLRGEWSWNRYFLGQILRYPRQVCDSILQDSLITESLLDLQGKWIEIDNH